MIEQILKKCKVCVLSLGMILLGAHVGVSQTPTAQELYDQGVAAFNAGDSTKAIDFYEKAIDADADFAPAYSGLGSIYLEQSDRTDDVIWLFEQAAELQPDNPENYNYMCRAYFQAQKFDWAEAACLKSLELNPNLGSAQLSLAWLYLFGKVEPAESIKYFNKVIEKIPNNPKIYYGLGMAYARNNEQAKALDVITSLRSMGQESLASQLEKMVRPAAIPEPMMFENVPSVPIPTEASPSRVVKAKPEEPPAVSEAASGAKPGTIRIQLKGRLGGGDTSAGATQAATAAETPTKKERFSDDDDYGPEDYKPLSIRQRQERIKQMRGNTGKMSGSGTVTTQTTGQ